MALIGAAPEVTLLIVVSALLFGWGLSFYHYRKRLEDTDRRLALREDEIQSLKSSSGKLKMNNEDHRSEIRDSVFVIEQVEWELHYKEKGNDSLYPFVRNRPVAEDVTLVLRVIAKITAAPARLVEDIQLSIAGNRIHLPADWWKPRLVGDTEGYRYALYFDIPPHIEHTSHKVHLIAECQGGVEKTSPIFRVPIARKYARSWE